MSSCALQSILCQAFDFIYIVVVYGFNMFLTLIITLNKKMLLNYCQNRQYILYSIYAYLKKYK
jgi:hypothetical protein